MRFCVSSKPSVLPFAVVFAVVASVSQAHAQTVQIRCDSSTNLAVATQINGTATTLLVRNRP